MPIVLNCSGCGKRYELADALAGKTGRCKQCGQILKIPVPRTLTPPAASSEPARPVTPTPKGIPPRSSPPPSIGPNLLDEFDEDGRIDDDEDGIPVAAEPVIKSSRYRSGATAGSSGSSGRSWSMPDLGKGLPKVALPEIGLPAMILGGGGTLWVLFLLFVVLPSIQGGEEGNGARGEKVQVPQAPAPALAGGQPEAVAAANPNGGAVPTLPPLPPALRPLSDAPPLRDLSGHEQLLHDAIGGLNQSHV